MNSTAARGSDALHKDFAWRYMLMGAVMSVMPILIIFQMVRIQTNPAHVEYLRQQSSTYSGMVQTIIPPRGEIYDRWGHLLAGNKTVYEVGIELSQVRNPNTIALALSTLLGLDYNFVFTAASQEASENAVYAVVANNVSKEQIDQLAELKDKVEEAYMGRANDPSLRGVVWYPKLARSYPEKEMGSNLLGFVNREGKGFFGVEEQYNNLLAGNPKTLWKSFDPNQVELPPELPEGASLVLTIDRAIQAAMEDVIDRAIETHGAESGTIVVVDPRSGEIMAMATTPRIDLNEYERQLGRYADGTPFNRAISQAYETGSVFKVLTMAAALDSGTVRPETTFVDTGIFEIGGTYIYNWNGGAWGPQDMTGCMRHSLNVCMAWLATQMKAKTFYDYMQAFGIGHLTGVDMAGENPGRLKLPGDEDWYDADLGTNSFGQGVSSTPLQMATAISAVANDGVMMTPHIVHSIVYKGYQYEIERRVSGRPISPQTARELTEMLAVSLEVESSDALVSGYRVAGKTGTGEIPTPFGYTSNQTNASFVGWGPVDDIRFVVYVWLEKPQSSIWGSEVAAPVFREAVEELVVLLNLPPDDVRAQLQGK